MTTRDFTANVISASKVVPDGNFKDSKASGVWDINEALDLIKGGNWPNVANINPAAFVDALFSVDVWDGDGTDSNTITSGIDLSNKGGLLWIKPRNVALTNNLFDTERGFGTTFGYRLISDLTNAQSEKADGLRAFNSNGFTLGNSTAVNGSSYNYVSWTFRKQPKFFDVVTYSGQNTDLALSHNLGVAPGMVIVKRTDTTGDWYVYHRSLNLSENLTLNSTGDVGGNNFWTSSAPSSTVFNIDGNRAAINQSGGTYVAYLFAHNNDDGGFGEPGDQDIIKCGSYTGNNSTDGPTINLGFEPQWLFIKHTDAAGNSSFIIDNMRGAVTGGNDASLSPNASNDEQTGSDLVEFNATGFQLKRANDNVNGDGNTYIYMAIRRGGMQTPSAASSVFHIQSQSNADAYSVGFPTDLILLNKTGGSSVNTYVGNRLTGNDKYLRTNTTTSEASSSNLWDFDEQNSFDQGASTSSAWVGYHWARARGFCDIVTYKGDGFSPQTVKHNMGVVPEMIWSKSRDSAGSWFVYNAYVTSDPENDQFKLESTQAVDDGPQWGRTAPTNAQFYVQGSNNTSNENYIAFLFASVSGVSKLGSFTQSGATNVDCGFTGDTPSFILIKRTDSTGSWYVVDSARGIIAGNDPYLLLDSTAAHTTDTDLVDPYSGGFATTSSLTNGDYIFYAIAAIS